MVPIDGNPLRDHSIVALEIKVLRKKIHGEGEWLE